MENNDQLLFDYSKQGDVPTESSIGPTKVCRGCKARKSIEDFPFFSSATCGRKNTCKTCSQELSALRKQLKSENPIPPPGKCPICHEHTEHWIMDHCHFQHKFRGYICNSCNLGIGRFNDDPIILKRAIEYLES